MYPLERCVNYCNWYITYLDIMELRITVMDMINMVWTIQLTLYISRSVHHQ